MFILVMTIADRIHPGSHKTAGALLGFVALAAFFGGPLSALLDRLFLRQMLGARIGLLVSCVVIWLLVLAYLLTLRPDGVEEHSPVLRVLGATIGMSVLFWFRLRRQERAAALSQCPLSTQSCH
jgi:hypothetical protein